MNKHRTAIPVFFSPEMVAESDSMSPSAAKPAAVVESWRTLGVPLAFHAAKPASVDELARAHDRAWVEDVLAGRATNGFGNRSLAVASSLPWTSGAMLTAARHVVTHGGIAAAPCSGFHHASWRGAGGFCTFNGLMVTACALRAEGRVKNVAILDCDMHYGDGTADIIDVLRAGPDGDAWIHHVTIGERYSAPRHAERFLRELPDLVDSLAACDLLLYQAGADPHIHDPLGGWLTTEELALRDAIVFQHAHRAGVPVVWNLAGGYQREADGSIPKVLAIHDNTMRACADVVVT